MTRDFFFEPSEFDVPTFDSLRSKFINVPDNEIKETIIKEAQYWEFHKFILKSLRHRDNLKNSHKSLPIGLDLRVIALKSGLIIAASIMEAILLAHALKKNYSLPEKEHHRTFGKVLSAWEQNATGKSDLDSYLTVLKKFNDIRNCIHLYKVKNDNEFLERLRHKK